MGDAVSDIPTAATLLVACRKLLSRIQWSGSYTNWGTSMPACPVCRAPQSAERGHDPGCELAKLAGIVPKPPPKSERDMLVDVLRSVEWITSNGQTYCPVCGYVREAGHRQDCRLAFVLPTPATPPTWPDVYDVDETTGEVRRKEGWGK